MMHRRLLAGTSLLAMRGKLGLVAVVGLAAASIIVAASPARADVIYSLVGGHGALTGTLTVPSVISTTTTFPISDFTGVTGNNANYTSATFAVTSTSDNLTLTDSVGFTPFTFPVGTFETNGTSTDNLGGGFNLTLTVSGVPAPASVPEPVSLMLLGTGLLGLGLIRRRMGA